ncbi:MAG: VOC family protein [Caldicoprobacterales bacterium]|nr:VOC family protein [Clostridia bacterium]MDI9513204.1 VOC family protein [Bacillota bacterium]
MQNNIMVQVGVVVRDIEKTARNFTKIFGVDMPHISLTDTRDKALTEYKGQPTEARAKLAFIDMGGMQLELIEPDDHPSTWKEFLDKHGEGIHHIALNVKGMKETVAYLENNGMPLVQKGEYTGGRYAYIDSSDKLGMIIELLEND